MFLNILPNGKNYLVRMTDKQWILLFSLNDRSHMQDNLNLMVSEYNITDMKVWTDQGNWCAMVRYIGKCPQIYLENNKEEQEETNANT